MQGSKASMQVTPAMTRAEEHADVVRRAYQAFNTGDIKALNELFDEQATWHTPGASPLAGLHRGRAAVFAQFGRYGGETGGTFKAALRQVLAGDDGRVVGLHPQQRGCAAGSDAMWSAALSSRSATEKSSPAASTSSTCTRGTRSGRS
jgi:ketosteroid isomerase-like protein